MCWLLRYASKNIYHYKTLSEFFDLVEKDKIYWTTYRLCLIYTKFLVADPIFLKGKPTPGDPGIFMGSYTYWYEAS